MQIERQWIIDSQKDPAAFQNLFDKYYNSIFNYILRRTCNPTVDEDITANTFLKALENIGRYQWKGVSFSAWLYRIATNEVNQNHRKTKRHAPLTSELMARLRSDSSSDAELLATEETMAKNEKFKRVHAAVLTLKPKYQSVITVRYFENLTIKEIADIMDLPVNTVKTHIHRGLRLLKNRL